MHCLHLSRQNKDDFFREIYFSLSKIMNKYKNVPLAGDVNIGLLNNSNDQTSHLPDLRDTFNFTNLFKEATCFKSGKWSLIDA